MNHTRLESMFRKIHAPHIHAHQIRHTHTHHAHTHDSQYIMYTLVHIVDVMVILQNFVMIGLTIQILQIKLFGLGKVLTPMDPRRYGYQNPLLFYLM